MACVLRAHATSMAPPDIWFKITKKIQVYYFFYLSLIYSLKMLQLLIKVLKIVFPINEKVFQKISFLSIIQNKQLFIITKIYLICKFVILNIKKKQIISAVCPLAATSGGAWVHYPPREKPGNRGWSGLASSPLPFPLAVAPWPANATKTQQAVCFSFFLSFFCRSSSWVSVQIFYMGLNRRRRAGWWGRGRRLWGRSWRKKADR